jgi:deoxyribose-phosphate aldolase
VTNLKGSSVVVAAVVGFHEGTQDTYEKLREARAAVAAGASELDLVLNHSLLTKHNRAQPPPVRSHDSAIDSITAANTAANSGSPPPAGTPDDIPDYSAIYRELASIRSLCPGVVIKLILETSQLDARQIDGLQRARRLTAQCPAHGRRGGVPGCARCRVQADAGQG